MACLAACVCALVDALELLPHVAQRRHVETHAHSPARTGAPETRAPADSQRRHHRQSIGEDDAKRGARGYDGAKKVTGRKRHLLVDTNGLILHAQVQEATIQDYRGGKRLLAPLKEAFGRLKLIWADSGYKKEGFDEWVKATLGWEVEIVEHPWSGLRGVWARHPMQ
jgi:putative transposase